MTEEWRSLRQERRGGKGEIVKEGRSWGVLHAVRPPGAIESKGGEVGGKR
jgi:hypothetical protein